MKFDGLKIGFALTGSFCTIPNVFKYINCLQIEGAEIWPLVSERVAGTDTRFGTAEFIRKHLAEITGKEPIDSVAAAERVGPGRMFDVLVVCPCTGNTLAKMAHGITDGTVTMAVKAHLRNDLPVVLAIATNDGLAGAMRNIAEMMCRKNIYFVPFEQDDCVKKPFSLVARLDLLVEAVDGAVMGKQVQPVLGMRN